MVKRKPLTAALTFRPVTEPPSRANHHSHIGQSQTTVWRSRSLHSAFVKLENEHKCSISVFHCTAHHRARGARRVAAAIRSSLLGCNVREVSASSKTRSFQRD